VLWFVSAGTRAYEHILERTDVCLRGSGMFAILYEREVISIFSVVYSLTRVVLMMFLVFAICFLYDFFDGLR
jgi:hypothetical protein